MLGADSTASLMLAAGGFHYFNYNQTGIYRLSPPGSRLARRLRMPADGQGKPIFSSYFNEAEARAPRMQPPYKPLGTKAISPRFRAIAHYGKQNLPNSACSRIDHVKEPYDSNKLPGFERVWGSARHDAARKCPAGKEHI